MEERLVYVGMVADLLHHGHVALLEEAARHGRVVVGLLTDEAAATYKRRPLLCWEERRAIVRALRPVSEVIPQESLDYRPNLRRLRPAVVVHGDDWRAGVQAETRAAVLATLAEWGGVLVEPPYTGGISSTLLWREVADAGVHPGERAGALRGLLESQRPLRLIEAHNALAGLLVEQANAGSERQFHALWLSSLTHATARGRPDTAKLGLAAVLATAREVLDATRLPLVVDGDNGGSVGELCTLVEALGSLGASAVVIEDKIGAKANSLLDRPQTQDEPARFAAKIAAARAAAAPGFQVVARCESLVLGRGQDDALARALRYAAAGAHGVLMHSKAPNAAEALAFAARWRAAGSPAPLWVVPTTWPERPDEELAAAGISVVVYANQLLRAGGRAMREAAASILRHGRTLELEPSLMPVRELIGLIPENLE